MHAAYRQVTGNKEAAGVDGMVVTDFPGQWKAEWEKIRTKFEAKTYQQQLLKCVSISNPNVGERKLGSKHRFSDISKKSFYVLPLHRFKN